MLFTSGDEQVVSVSDSKKIVRRRGCMRCPWCQRIRCAEYVEARRRYSELTPSDRDQYSAAVCHGSQGEYPVDIVRAPLLAVGRNGHEAART